MTRVEFWAIIDRARTADRDAYLTALHRALEQLSVDDVESFHTHFELCLDSAYRYDLWAAAALIDGFEMTDDSFTDFLRWLVSKGRKIFEAALRNPDSLAKAIKDRERCEFESIAFVAGWAWEAKIGKAKQQMPCNDIPDEPRGEPIDEADWPELFPKLYARFSDDAEDDVDED